VLTAGGGLLGTALAGRLALSTERASPDRDDDWPMDRRDPGGTSYARGVAGPRDDVAVRWTHSLDGRTGLLAPTPVVADGTVYVVGDGLTAVDAAGGTERFHHPNSPIAPPAVATATAYKTPTVVLAGNRTLGLHARGGPSLFGWRPAMTRWTTTPHDDEPSFSFGGPTETPPVAADGTVLVDSAGALTAFDASSGAVRWQADRTQRRPAVRDGTVYALGLESLYGFDLTRGDRTTVATVDRGLRSVTAAPDRLVVGTYESLVSISYDGIIEWEYAPDGEASLEEVAPAVADGVVYASFAVDETQRLLALDATDGTTLWEAPLAVDQGGGRAALAVSEAMLYVPTPDGGLVGVDRADGRVRWRFETDTAYPWSSVAVADGLLYAFADRTLYALEAA
jgi:outer membrane protein assembly factor BamB